MKMCFNKIIWMNEWIITARSYGTTAYNITASSIHDISQTETKNKCIFYFHSFHENSPLAWCYVNMRWVSSQFAAHYILPWYFEWNFSGKSIKIEILDSGKQILAQEKHLVRHHMIYLHTMIDQLMVLTWLSWTVLFVY